MPIGNGFWGATFAGMLDAEQRAVLVAHGERRQAGRGEHLPVDDTLTDALYLVVAGSIRHYRVSRAGEEVTLSITGAGHAFFLVVDGGGGYDADQGNDYLEALADQTLAYRIAGTKLDALRGGHPTLAPVAEKVLRRMLADAQCMVEDLALHTVTARLARLLARLAATDPTRLAVMTQREIACLIGASREEVSRSLRALREQGLIDFQPHQHAIVVCDPARLGAL